MNGIASYRPIIGAYVCYIDAAVYGPECHISTCQALGKDFATIGDARQSLCYDCR